MTCQGLFRPMGMPWSLVNIVYESIYFRLTSSKSSLWQTHNDVLASDKNLVAVCFQDGTPLYCFRIIELLADFNHQNFYGNGKLVR